MNTVGAVPAGVDTPFAVAAGVGTLFAAAGAFALSSSVLAILCGGFLYNSVILSRVVLLGIVVPSLALAVFAFAVSSLLLIIVDLA